MNSHILAIDCPDHKGLVSKITRILFKENLNIEEQAEFVEKEQNHFFLRTEFSGDFCRENLVKEIGEIVPAKSNLKLVKKGPRKIVVLATREAHCLGDLLIKHEYKELNADLQSVISNRTDLEKLVTRFEIPFHLIPHQDRNREEHSQDLLNVLKQYDFDYLVLAKYMRVLTPAVVNEYQNQIVNIHHSFLPAFAGARPYHQAFKRGVKIIGATAHFVTEDLDEGPIIAQDTASVDHTASATDMVQLGKNIEKTVLTTALKAVFEDRVFVHGNKTVIL